MFQNLPSSNKSERNKTNPSLLCPFSSPPPPHHQAAWKGPVYSLSLLPNLPLTPQPSTIWLPPYHSTETALSRVTLFECKRLTRQCRHRPMFLTTASSGPGSHYFGFLLGHVVTDLSFVLKTHKVWFGDLCLSIRGGVSRSITRAWYYSGCCCLVAESCLALCDPMDYNPSGSSVHGILPARILEWVATSFSRGSSQPRDWTQVSYLAGGFFTAEPPGKSDTTQGRKLLGAESRSKGN